MRIQEHLKDSFEDMVTKEQPASSREGESSMSSHKTQLSPFESEVPGPTPSLSYTPATSYGMLLNFIRSRPGWTRQQLLAATGMSRSTLFDRLDTLFQLGFVFTDGSAPEESTSRRGRKSELLRWDTRGRRVLVFDLGQTQARICVTDVFGQVQRMRELTKPINTDAAHYLETIFAEADHLIRAGEDESLIGVSLGIPGPVDPRTGVLGASTTMPKWENYPIPELVREKWHVPVVIENDARAFALGESEMIGADKTVLAIKFATGIGAGVVDVGHVLEGADGAAGDIGHVRISTDGPRCTCGRRGCLAAWASGHALLQQLRPTGIRNLAELITRAAAGDPLVCDALDSAVTHLARVLATVVATVNPDHLVLGGTLGQLPRVISLLNQLIREDVNERARKHLVISGAHLGADGAVFGLVHKLVDAVYSPAAIDDAVAAHLTGDTR